MSDKTILIVDDDYDIRMTFRMVLEQEGYEVLEAASAKEGREKIKESEISLVFLDVMMEDADSGYSFAREVVEEHPDLPIVMVSSFADAAMMTFDISELPVKEYLQKPLSPKKIKSLAEKYIK
jgi:two-component system nitrogen regulation response regulator NtrX